MRPLTATATAVAVSLTCVAGAATPATAAPRVVYAALGDSYASGLGAGPYDAASGDCDRSANAYPALWSAAHSPAAFAFLACAGATTADVRGGQLAALPTDATVVTVTVGGNDVGFTDAIRTCVLGADSDCWDAVHKAEGVVRGRLRGDLDTTLHAVGSRAPGARIVVVGYPRLFETGSCFLGLSQAKRKVVDEAADLLDDTLQDRATAAGARFVDVRARFAGHGVCADDEWLHGVDLLALDESYHPTSTGQRDGYLPEVTGALG